MTYGYPNRIHIRVFTSRAEYIIIFNRAIATVCKSGVFSKITLTNGENLVVEHEVDEVLRAIYEKDSNVKLKT